MAPPYKLTVPRNKGELDDLLGAMVLDCPEFNDSFFPGRDKDAVFEELNLGIDAVVQAGITRDALREMAKQARAYCDSRETKAAIQVLDAMS